MGIRPNTITSNVAGVGTTPLGQDLEKAGSKDKLLKVAAFGAAIIPVVGAGVSWMLDRTVNRRAHDRKMEVLAKKFRFEVAAVLGKNPDSVTGSDLRLASYQNKSLAQLVSQIDQEKKSANRSSTFSNVAVGIAGSVVPVAGGIVATTATHLGAAFAGSAISDMMNKDVLNVQEVIVMLDAKKQEGQPITAADVALLRMAQMDNYQQGFKDRYKTPFHKMSPETQTQVLLSLPELSAGADVKADALNRGLISPQSLVMEGPESGTNFAASIGPRAQTGSFASRITAERQLAAQGMAQQSIN